MEYRIKPRVALNPSWPGLNEQKASFLPSMYSYRPPRIIGGAVAPAKQNRPAREKFPPKYPNSSAVFELSIG